MEYWLGPELVSPGVWITVFLAVIICVNGFAIRLIRPFEFWLGLFKMIVIIGLMILSLILALGGGPDKDAKGFRYWSQPGAFAVMNDDDNNNGHQAGNITRLSAVWRTVPSTTFAYIGTEMIGMTVSESENPRDATVRAVKVTFYRILIFHIVGATLLGMLVPYDTPHLSFAIDPSETAAPSAFIVAIQMAGIRVLPDILNACILVFVVSAADYSLFLATVSLCGLAEEGMAPSILSSTLPVADTSRLGEVPVYALGTCSILSVVAYASMSGITTVVFEHMVNFVTILGLLVWISILTAHICFVRARKTHNLNMPDMEEVAFKAPLGTLGSWVALVSCIVISLTKSVHLFAGDPFDYVAFVTSYLGIPAYLALIFGYKAFMRLRSVRAERQMEADLPEESLMECVTNMDG